MNGFAECLMPHPEGVCLKVKVVPRSSRNEIGEVLGDRLKIRISAPPVDSAANDELVSFLARQFALPRSGVRLIHGQTSRSKTMLLRGRSIDQAMEQLTR